MLYKILRPLIFWLDPETAHDFAICFLKYFPNAASLFALNYENKNLRTKLWDIDFPNPIGMAAGFDKNAEVIKTLFRFGFGFVEVGTVTPRPQKGNNPPRIFRLNEDKAIINHLGFNNLGARVFEKNINRILPKITNLSSIVGVNIGKNKDSKDAILDYLLLLDKFYEMASYITINISSPNTENLRDLQKEENLDVFLSEIMRRKNELKIRHKKNTPILLKIAPDLSLSEQKKIAGIILKNKIDGLIISNTTIDRDVDLKSKNSFEGGGLSGAPLFKKSNLMVKNFYKFTKGQVPIIGVGGIFSAADAYQKIKCGASLVQIYSACIYQGFGLVEKIKTELSEMVKKDGFTNISQAVGVDAKVKSEQFFC